MQRREFITLLGGAATAPSVLWPLAARAQQDDRVRTLQMRILRMHAETAATRIGLFIREIENQVRWTTRLPWAAGTIDQRRFDGLQLLRQLPTIVALAQLDSAGTEQLKVSRLAMDVIASKADLSAEPQFAEAVAKKVYYSPVYFREYGPVNARVSEPSMTLSLAGTRRDFGVSVVEVNLKLIWDVVTGTRIGERGVAYILDAQGRVIAHPDMSMAQRNADFSSLAHVQAARAGGSAAAAQSLQAVKDINGREVLVAYAAVVGPSWLVFVELPAEEANAPAQ